MRMSMRIMSIKTSSDSSTLRDARYLDKKNLIFVIFHILNNNFEIYLILEIESIIVA